MTSVFCDVFCNVCGQMCAGGEGHYGPHVHLAEGNRFFQAPGGGYYPAHKFAGIRDGKFVEPAPQGGDSAQRGA